jgi:hypothetical protein
MRAAGTPCSFIVRLSALRSRHLHVQLFSRDFLGLAIVEHCRPSACLPLAGRADSRPHLSRDREVRHARLPYRPEAGRNVGAVREEFLRLRRTEPARSRASAIIDRAGIRESRSSQCNFSIRDPLLGEVEDIICRADFPGFDGFALAVHGTSPPMKDLHIGCASSILSRDHIARMLTCANCGQGCNAFMRISGCRGEIGIVNEFPSRWMPRY